MDTPGDQNTTMEISKDPENTEEQKDKDYAIAKVEPTNTKAEEADTKGHIETTPESNRLSENIAIDKPVITQQKKVKVTAFYKLHPTTNTEGRLEWKNIAYDIIRMDSVKRGDHFDFKLSKIPSDFAFIGWIDADIGTEENPNRYLITPIKCDEYRRMDGDILQIALDLPIDSGKCVKRLLFGPKSVLSQENPELPYAFVSDHILVSKKESPDFVECERMLMWFFFKNGEEFSFQQFPGLILHHFERKKKFMYPSNPNIIEKAQLKDNDMKEIIAIAFPNGPQSSALSKERFMQFWNWYAYTEALILKVINTF
jgi:hypothetical protein